MFEDNILILSSLQHTGPDWGRRWYQSHRAAQGCHFRCCSSSRSRSNIQQPRRRSRVPDRESHRLTGRRERPPPTDIRAASRQTSVETCRTSPSPSPASTDRSLRDSRPPRNTRPPRRPSAGCRCSSWWWRWRWWCSPHTPPPPTAGRTSGPPGSRSAAPRSRGRN